MYGRTGYKRRYTSTAKPKAPVIEYPIADVFAAAAAAQRINGEYVKDNCVKWEIGKNGEELAVPVSANKHLVRKFLAESLDQVTEADRNEGAAVRSYWKMKMFAVLQGNANEFISNAVKTASKDTVASNDPMSLGLISSLPASYIRGMAQDTRTEIKQDAVIFSEHQGKVGEHIIGKVVIIDCIYSKNWGCYYITGKIGHNVFLWTSNSEVAAGTEFNLKGRVKRHRDDNITQLNYVKLT